MKISDLGKDELKKLSLFHRINPDQLEGLQDYAEWLEAILHGPCYVHEEQGKLILVDARVLIDRLNGLKITIYSDEHPPPHFHVNSPTIDASFCIDTCEILEGQIPAKIHKKIRFWHIKAKSLLIQHWNSSRPVNCTVGSYKGNI